MAMGPRVFVIEKKKVQVQGNSFCIARETLFPSLPIPVPSLQLHKHPKTSSVSKRQKVSRKSLIQLITADFNNISSLPSMFFDS